MGRGSPGRETHTLLKGLAILAAIGLGITAYFIGERSWPASGFAAASIALLLCTTRPRFR